MECIFTIDVEDWFHILNLESTPDVSEWDSLESRVNTNFIKLLDIFNEHNVKASCFFLGWIAEKFPNLVKIAYEQGHEICSHGFSHKLVYKSAPEEFLEDIQKAKETIDKIIPVSVKGFRAPGFSVTRETPWFFERLSLAGYEYDSSIFPTSRQHGGLTTSQFSPFIQENGIWEFPISVKKIFGYPMYFFGGGYLRFFPYWLIKYFARKILAQGRPVIFYIHPREIDPEHPRLAMNVKRKFKSYCRLKSVPKKLNKLLNEFSFITFQEYIEKYGEVTDEKRY